MFALFAGNDYLCSDLSSQNTPKEGASASGTVAGAGFSGVKTSHSDGGPCAGGVLEKSLTYRRLRSLKTGRVVHEMLPETRKEKTFDPTAWYVAELKKSFTELKACDFINSSGGVFVNDDTKEPYHAEAYAAVEVRKKVSKVVIRHKIFIRVGEENRVDVLRKCPYLQRYMTDPSLSSRENGSAAFARVPDRQIETLKEILNLADGTVEYSEFERPQVNDLVMLNDGLLSKSEFLKDQKGTIATVNGKTHVTVVLDKLGCFKFVLPASSIGKLTTVKVTTD